MNHRKNEAPSISIEGGYYMTRARQHWPDGVYLGVAIAKVEEAVAYLAENHGMYEMQGSETLYFLNEAAHAGFQMQQNAPTDEYRIAQGKHAIGRAHNAARLVMDGLGFRPITNKDFEEFGAGGGR